MLPPFESDDCEDDQHGIPRHANFFFLKGRFIDI